MHGVQPAVQHPTMYPALAAAFCSLPALPFSTFRTGGARPAAGLRDWGSASAFAFASFFSSFASFFSSFSSSFLALRHGLAFFSSTSAHFVRRWVELGWLSGASVTKR